MVFKVLGISSSRGEFSFSAAGLNTVLEKIKENGAEAELLDLKQTTLHYSQLQAIKMMQLTWLQKW